MGIRNIITITTILLATACVAQEPADYIITKELDTIACKITSYNKQNIFYDYHKVSKSGKLKPKKSTFISTEDVVAFFCADSAKVTLIPNTEKHANYSESIEATKENERTYVIEPGQKIIYLLFLDNKVTNGTFLGTYGDKVMLNDGVTDITVPLDSVVMIGYKPKGRLLTGQIVLVAGIIISVPVFIVAVLLVPNILGIIAGLVLPTATAYTVAEFVKHIRFHKHTGWKFKIKQQTR